MFGSRIFLFLFGATVISGHVLRNGIPHAHKKIHSVEREVVMEPILARFMASEFPMTKEIVSPLPAQTLMPQFLQQGSNLFYKPHVMLSPTHYITSPAAALIEKDCKHDVPELPMPEIQTVMFEEPLYVPEIPVILPEPQEEIKEFKPIVIPPAPELSPLTYIPTVDIVEEPKPLQPLPVPEPQFIEVPLAPEIKPIEIPKAPELGPFVMPEIPTAIVVEDPLEPCVHEMNVPFVTHSGVLPSVQIMEYIPMDIPQPPVLPPFVMPEFPTILTDKPISVPTLPDIKPQEIPEAPMLPPFVMPQLPTPNVVEIFPPVIPMDIPQPPVLPPFVMPEFPTILTDKPISVPTLPDIKPQEIPEAPMLPPFVMPQLPTPNVVEIFPPVNPQSIEENLSPAPFLPEFHINIRPVIPEAPILKPIVMPQIPESVLVEMTNNLPVEPEEIVPEIKPAVVIETMPPAPELGQFIMPELPIIQNVEYNDVELPSQNQHQIFEIPTAPMLPPMVIPQLPTSSIEIPVNPQLMEVYPCPPQDLPPAPVPYKPEVTVAQLLGEEPVYAEFRPMDIPEAPVLKPLEMPQIPEPVLVETSNKDCDESIPADEIVSNHKPHVIFESLPSAPVLSPLAMPQIPTIQKVDLDNILVHYQQKLPAFSPTFYAQNIIIERVLPNLISEDNCAENVKLVSAGRKHPVFPKSYFTPALF